MLMVCGVVCGSLQVVHVAASMQGVVAFVSRKDHIAFHVSLHVMEKGKSWQ